MIQPEWMQGQPVEQEQPEWMSGTPIHHEEAPAPRAAVNPVGVPSSDFLSGAGQQAPASEADSYPTRMLKATASAALGGVNAGEASWQNVVDYSTRAAVGGYGRIAGVPTQVLDHVLDSGDTPQIVSEDKGLNLDPFQGRHTPENSTAQTGLLVSPQTQATLGESMGQLDPISQSVAGLAAIPGQMVDPRQLAAMEAGKAIAGGVMSGPTGQSLSNIATRVVGPAGAATAGRIASSALNVGGFSAAADVLENGVNDPSRTAEAGVKGAIAGVGFGVGGELIGRPSRAPAMSTRGPELKEAPAEEATPDAPTDPKPVEAEKKATLTKEDVKKMAGEGVDQEALDQLLKDEPHVQVEVTPGDFNDIPRQNIKIDKVNSYAAMDAKTSPPILAAVEGDGSLRIADGRHRLLAAAQRAKLAGTDPMQAKVAAVVPESWAKKKGLLPPDVAEAPKVQAGSARTPTIEAAMGAAAAKQFQGNKLLQGMKSMLGTAKTQAGIAKDSALSALSRNAMPKTTAISEEAADAGVRFAAAHQSVEPNAKAAVSEVLPDKFKDEAFRHRLGAVLVEGRLRAIRDKFIHTGRWAEAKMVGTLIGSAESPFKTEADYRAARADKEVQAAIERHKNVVQSAAEHVHEELGGKLDVYDEDGAFVNLRALDANVPADQKIMPGQRRGNLRNPRLQKSAFAIPASGDAKAYETDYQKIVENTLGRNAERVAKKRFVDTLVDKGVARIMTPHEAADFNPNTSEKWPDFHGRRAVRIEGVVDYAYADKEGHAVQVKKDLYVDPRVESEVRSAFNVDSPVFQKAGLNWATHALTHTQIIGPVDFVYHTARIFAQVANSPGGKSFVADLARKVPGVNVLDSIARVGANVGKVFMDSPEVRRQLASLSEIGATRRESKGALSVIDKAGRLALDNMFDNLVERGLVKDTERIRRNFSNQVGQYNSRLQTRIVRELKESGLSPFITAGLSGNVEGIKAMLGDPVAEGLSPRAKAQLWGTQIAGHIVSLSLPAAINLIMTGSILGRPGVPMGAIDTGKQDKDGNPLYIDPLKWSGVRRGLRATGINAFAERKRTGGSDAEAANDAWKNALNSWTHPFAGPAVNFGVVAATGHDTSGKRDAGVVKPGDSQGWENLKAALRQANPTVESYLEGREKGGTKEGTYNTVKSLSSAVGVGTGHPVTEAAKHGAELNDYRDDLKRRAKKVPRHERIKFIQNDMKGLSARDKERIYADIQEHPLSWMGKPNITKEMQP